jgi:Flp pilus assembly protein TadG
MGIRSFLKRATTFKRRKSYRSDDKGATAVEFAMVAPLFFTMLGVTLETGVMMFSEYVLQTSVQEAARIVRTGQAHDQKLSAATFKNKICDLAGLIMDCNGKVTVHLSAQTNFATLSNLTPSYLNVGLKSDGTGEGEAFNCGQPSQSVALIATYDWDFVIPFLMKFYANHGEGTRRLAGFAMFKNEPFPAPTANKCG